METTDGNLYLPILHLPRVELRCKLQEKLHRVTGPLGENVFLFDYDNMLSLALLIM